MQKMRGGMVGARRLRFVVHLQIDGIADRKRAFHDLDDMHMQASEFLFGVDDAPSLAETSVPWSPIWPPASP